MTDPMELDMAESETTGNLMPVQLFQARDGALDLVQLNPGDPVVVSVFLRDAAAGDQFVVYFGEQPKPVTVASASQFVIDALFSVAELPPLGQSYEVYYTFRDGMSPKATIDLLDSTIALSAPRLHVSSFFGTYRAGVLDAWVVPSSYQLEPTLPTIGSIGEAPPNIDDLALNINRCDASGQTAAIGSIAYDNGKRTWSIDIFESLRIEKGDLLSIEMPAGPSASVQFSACF
jgi:hypothetical protein